MTLRSRLWSPRAPAFWPFTRHGVSPAGIDTIEFTWLGCLWRRAVTSPWIRCLCRGTEVEAQVGPPSHLDRLVFVAVEIAVFLRAEVWAPVPFLLVGRLLWWAGLIHGYRLNGPCSKRWLRQQGLA